MQANGVRGDRNQRFYRHAIRVLRETGVPFLVGGAFALESYTGLVRRTKDLDVFVRPGDCDRLLSRLHAQGFRTELRFPHWLGKAFKRGHFIDVIFSSGNGICHVDDLWFQHAVPADVLGMEALIIPAEEMMWSKAFIMERERFDGGDIAHLLHAQAKSLDWARVLARFNRHWRVLFAHLVLFGFIYPGHRLQIPSWLMNELMERLKREMVTLSPDPEVCQGTLLSWSQYLVNTDRGDYADARHIPRGTLTAQETRHVTQVLACEEESGAKAAMPFLPPKEPAAAAGDA
jgi:hypothetical protein